jgi:hypothetical protein
MGADFNTKQHTGFVAQARDMWPQSHFFSLLKGSRGRLKNALIQMGF